MKINQAFHILQKSGGIRAARILTNDKKQIPYIYVLWMAHQLKRGMPVAKINHEKWFYGLKFYTNKHTLDPRPDTETLVDAVINENKNIKNLRILDMGTGTGCLIISIVNNIPESSGVGIDKYKSACRAAKKNVKNMGMIGKVLIKNQSFEKCKLNEKFDIIVSNPPYIAKNDKRVDVGAMHDPKSALYAGTDGLDAYRQIAKSAKNNIKENGKIYLELGINQSDSVRNIFIRNGWKYINSYNDLSGIERVICFTV